MTDFLNIFAGYITVANLTIILYVLNAIIALGLIFFDDKSPAATMSWIMVLFLLPFIGFFLYLIFSQNISRMKIYRMSEREKNDIDTLILSQKKFLREYMAQFINSVADKWHNMISMNLDYAESILTYNDDVDLIFDGKQMFERLMTDIKNAKYSVKICCYIIKDDEVGRSLIDLLTEKAREGVKVRLLIDALGSRNIGMYDLKKFKEAGGRYAFFFKPIIRNLFFRINYRNHRKIFIIDNEVGYIGGFNIGNEYLGFKKKFGNWRDTQLIIRGNAVAALNERFYLDWRYSSKEDFDIVDKSLRHAFKPNRGNIPIQIVSCGPESAKEEVKRAMMKMITGATESIFIQTPYLVPDEPMLDSLAMAAGSGVDVRIMIPNMPDHPFVYRTTLYNAGKLIAEGAKIYIYDDGFLHAKMLTVDGQVATAGSTNFDIRSFRLNFETNAFIYDEGVTARLNQQFEKDMLVSREYTQFHRDNVGSIEKAKESISRLLAEIL